MTIKQARQEKGLTQKALSDLLGCSKRAVEVWESGKIKPWTEKIIVFYILHAL